jgi:hypothetical protein
MYAPHNPSIALRARHRDQLTDQAGGWQRGQQQAEALQRPQQQQIVGATRPAADGAGHSQRAESQQHAAAQPEAVGGEADGQAQRHAGKLHHGEQKAGLQQGDAQSIPQRRQGRRQFAHMQRGAHAGQDDQQGGVDEGALHAFRRRMSGRCGPPLRRAAAAR